uniref:Uncharacterized protein n=1 Tax=Aureoumbra lagunensis TaxID=44058 RepID=A0A7S3JVV2_9STRA|mmetsp:Transcript_12387/g.18599  ORF Transcript_12387/g.18599 Transcript_12387/m.18599 type:complete len:322 (+) Transcript_12387:162-1127(+)
MCVMIRVLSQNFNMSSTSIAQKTRKRKDSTIATCDSSSSGGGAKEKRRRFVWPNELHSDFISAVFDLGLKAATIDAVTESFPKPINPEHLKNLLQNYRDARHIIAAPPTEYKPRKSINTSIIQEQEQNKKRIPSLEEEAQLIKTRQLTKRGIEIAERQMSLAKASQDCITSFQPKLQAHHQDIAQAIKSKKTRGAAASINKTSRDRANFSLSDSSRLKRTQKEMEVAMNFHRKMRVTRDEAQNFPNLETNSATVITRTRLPHSSSSSDQQNDIPMSTTPAVEEVENDPLLPLEFADDDDDKLDAEIFRFLIEDLPPSSASL